MSKITKWMQPFARFEAQIVQLPVTPELLALGFKTGCWEWTGKVRKDGYAKIKVDGETVYAHRFSYQHFKGLVGYELCVDHRCRNRKCVNPEHLQLVTHSESNFVSNGPAAQQTSKTHCPQGHPYNEDNTYVTRQSSGSGSCRQCKVCVRDRDRRARLEKTRINNLKRVAKGWKPFKSKYEQIYS